MAFTNTPIADTYSTHQLELVHDLDILNGSVNLLNPVSGMYNVLPFKHDDKAYGETRNALKMYQVVAGSKIIRGMYVWEKTLGTVYYFVVTTDGVNTSVYTATDYTSTWTAVTTFASANTAPARFTEYIDATNTKKLIMVDGDKGYVFTSNAAGTQITDVDFPSPHVPFPVFIDGYLFLAKAGTGDIYNSDLNAPDSWTAGNFISAEMYPDDIQALVKVNNYLLAIGKESGEYFYDAANAIGSPLARYDGAVLPFGTVFPNSIAYTKDTIMVLANSSDGESSFKVIEGFKHADFPAVTLIRVLASTIQLGNTTAAKVRGNFFRQSGDLFYNFHFDGTDTTGALPNTLIAALSQKIWSRGLFSTSAMPMAFTAQSTSGNIYTFSAGAFNGMVLFGIMQTDSIGNGDQVVTGSPASYSVAQTIYVPPESFGSLNRKFMSRAALEYYGVDSLGFSGTISLAYSDTNMGSFTTARNLAGSASGPDGGFPFITQLGFFRTRGWKIAATGGTGRYLYLEVDINKGSQ